MSHQRSGNASNGSGQGKILRAISACGMLQLECPGPFVSFACAVMRHCFKGKRPTASLIGEAWSECPKTAAKCFAANGFGWLGKN